jgi:3-deoxy-D-arabino-heptulosonate 7-phosphate (DAHP) synthase class II
VRATGTGAVDLRSDARQHRDAARRPQDPALREHPAELEQAFRIHEEMGSRLGGVHFELTGEDVTECTGGARGLADADLQRAYKSRSTRASTTSRRSSWR